MYISIFDSLEGGICIFQLKYKIWIENSGKVFGKGPLELLLGVKEKGSLSEAARCMNMSYNKAYTLIRTIEGKLGCKLITSKSGGENGGGSELTEEAEKLMEVYTNFQSECEASIQQLFKKHFDEFKL